jgi:hypothetical protein
MTHKNDTSEGAKNTPRDGVAKKPYTKPEFRYERVFETLALACGKLHGSQGQCRFNRKRS